MTVLAAVWIFGASVIVGGALWAAASWVREEWRVARLRRQINRRDRTEMRRHQAMRGAL